MMLYKVLLINLNLSVLLGAVNHEVWIPMGKHVHLPCWISDIEKNNNLSYWMEPDSNLVINNDANDMTVWFNRVSNLIHVGTVLSLYLPSPGTSEIALTQNPPKKHGFIQGLEVDLKPDYKLQDVGTHTILYSQNLETITCSSLKFLNIKGAKSSWIFSNRRTLSKKQAHFKFHTYVQPLILWSYALERSETNIEKNIAEKFESSIKEWCNAKVNKTQNKFSPCKDIIIQIMPIYESSNSINFIPMKPVKDSYVEINIAIELVNTPLMLLANPTDKTLSRIHALLKTDLDRKLMFLMKNISNNETTHLPTRVQAICPPGSHTYVPTPVIKEVTEFDLKPILTDNSSAYPLEKWPLMCHACPPGQAPRTPYAFDGCHLCPRGHYLGETGWPASAGCLPCPDGFTTDRVGATSATECELDAGFVTRWIIYKLLSIWLEFESIIGNTVNNDILTRALRQEKRSEWVWIGKINLKAWIVFSLYIMIVIWFSTLAIYRLHLYAKLHSMFVKQFRLLLKMVLIGQINIVYRIKQKSKQKGDEEEIDEAGDNDDDA